jgi:poly(3-hydroxybutyrate) depolymerase
LSEKIHGSGRDRPDAACSIGEGSDPICRFDRTIGERPIWRSFMKFWTLALCLLAACTGAHAATTVWQPAAGNTQIPIWPAAAPGAQPVPGPEKETRGAVTNVTRPTMTVYAPKGENTGAAVVVFPGGGFQILAIELEGTEICGWLTSRGITCVLLKYRVPSVPYVWQCDCRPHNYQLSVPSLQDAQRTMRLVRHGAAQWHIDPHRIGVIGFSAGGYLVRSAPTSSGACMHPSTPPTGKVRARISRCPSTRDISRWTTTAR